MARIELNDVSKVFPSGVRAVDHVTLAIEDREFVVLVGPSGCGKSTTLRMIVGLERASSGTIRIGDRVVNEAAPRDRDVAMVFQNYALYPHLTVYKNMAFGLRLRRRELRLGKVEIDKMVREAAGLLGIEALLDRRPAELSGGQCQRVAVGRAIVRRPKVFLFDEPLSNLDAKLRVELRLEIKRLQRRLATTTVYVTHDQEEAMTLGDRVVVLKDGIVQQSAPPLEVYERPANRFVGSSIGMPAMSFLNGRVVRDGGGGIGFDAGDGTLPLPASAAGRLAQFADREMVLGLRPEAISLAPPARGDDGGVREGTCAARMSVRVTFVEPLGDCKNVGMTTRAGGALIGRVDARAAAREGEQLEVSIDMTRVHVFEPGETGANVSAVSAMRTTTRAS